MKTSYTLQLELNKTQLKCLEEMVETGLHGFSIEDAAERALDSQFIHFYRRASTRGQTKPGNNDTPHD